MTFNRDVAGITMDLNSIEHIDFNALGGADNINVGDLTGTGVTQVAIDLESTPRSGVGDGAADTVTVNGTPGSDNIQVAGAGGSVTVAGLPATVTLAGAEEPTINSSSRAVLATTSSPLPALRPVSSASPSTAAPATTSSPAATAPTGCSAATATTP